jgi:hypothetical protein
METADYSEKLAGDLLAVLARWMHVPRGSADDITGLGVPAAVGDQCAVLRDEDSAACLTTVMQSAIQARSLPRTRCEDSALDAVRQKSYYSRPCARSSAG